MIGIEYVPVKLSHTFESSSLCFQYCSLQRGSSAFKSPKQSVAFLTPVSPESDENEISLYTVNSCSNIQVMRIKKMINKEEMSWY